MENVNVIWTSEHEAAYFEERKNKCEHCQPDNEVTISWLESVAAQDLVHTAFAKYGISPKTIYSEYEQEFATVYSVEQIEAFVQELAV